MNAERELIECRRTWRTDNRSTKELLLHYPQTDTIPCAKDIIGFSPQRANRAPVDFELICPAENPYQLFHAVVPADETVTASILAHWAKDVVAGALVCLRLLRAYVACLKL